jgi:hypothetical protein
MTSIFLFFEMGGGKEGGNNLERDITLVYVIKRKFLSAN